MDSEKNALSLDHLAERLGGRITGDKERLVAGVGTPREHDSRVIVPLWDFRERDFLTGNPVLLTREDLLPPGFDAVLVDNPKESLVPLLEAFQFSRPSLQGIHPTAFVHSGAQVHPTAWVGPQCVVEEGAVVAEGVFLAAQVYVGAGAEIGPRTRIEPQVVVYEGVCIEEDVIIHSGTVLGADGFGFEPGSDEEPPAKIPQIGRVAIECGVEIGANVTVDRGTIGTTRIGRYSKLDDQVHIGHNCVVGEGCLLVAFAGMAGSSVLEDNVILAARSGVADHVSVGKGSQIAACGGATKDIPPGSVVSGFPAWDHRKQLRVQSSLRRMPELMHRIRALEKELADLQKEFPR